MSLGEWGNGWWGAAWKKTNSLIYQGFEPKKAYKRRKTTTTHIFQQKLPKILHIFYQINTNFTQPFYLFPGLVWGWRWDAKSGYKACMPGPYISVCRMGPGCIADCGDRPGLGPQELGIILGCGEGYRNILIHIVDNINFSFCSNKSLFDLPYQVSPKIKINGHPTPPDPVTEGCKVWSHVPLWLYFECP